MKHRPYITQEPMRIYSAWVFVAIAPYWEERPLKNGMFFSGLAYGGGGKHDFFVGDFVFVGIVFLFLVIFREQLLAALVGGGNSRFVFTPLDDCDFTMRAWQECVLLSPGFRAKK